MAKLASRLNILLAENDGRFAIDEFLRLWDADEPIPQEILDFIAEAFRRNQDGEKLDKAFGLIGGKGRKPTTGHEADRQTALVVRILELVDSGACCTEAEAKEVVAQESEAEGGPGLRAIEGYLKRDREWARYVINVKQSFQAKINRSFDCG